MATNGQALPRPVDGAVRRAASGPRELYTRITPVLRAVIMLTIMAATLMEVLDTSIVNVALPDMMGNLGATLDQIGWVSTGYIISNVIVLPLTGWLSDYFGRKRYLTYSVILFTVASFGCGISRSLGELVLWRILQGAGGAAFLSTAQATLIEIFPPARRGFAQAMFGIGVIAAPTLGPTLGGIITDHYSWPWIFFVNLPVGIVAAVMTMLFVPDSAAAGAKRGADFVGIAFLALGLGCLQTVLERGESEDWFSTGYIVWLSVLAVVGIALFLWWELRPENRNPAIDLRIITNRNLAAGTAYAFAFGFVLYGGVFVLPQFLQNVQRHTAEQAGLLLMPGGLATAAMMPIVGQLVNRVDKRLIIGVGMCLFVASMFQFTARLTMTIPDAAFTWPLMLRGAAIGLQFVPLSLVAFGTLRPQQVAAGAGLYNLFRQLGGSFGIALLATLVDRRTHFHTARLAEHLSAFDAATQQRLAQLQANFMAHGMSLDAAQQAAYRALSSTVAGQAAVLTYMDVFRFMGYVGIGALLLLLLFQRGKNMAAAAAAAH
jgi:DHA2 family multidrug resistance protein